MDVVAEEARASYREEVVVSLPSNTVEDLESNVARVAAWAAAWDKDNAARRGGGGGGGGGGGR
jgi:adenylate kinase